ncbi:TPA: hypothetical protein NIK24_004987 [Pseudomonas aeruginosa]|nr:hypothetical protein [Pseudomonas aeruginosa]
MSKELNKAPVEQAGGDERAAFFKHLIGRHPAHETEIVRVVEHNHAAWKAWQARAALAQPSPAQAEQAEAERPPQPERYTADVFHPERPYYTAQTSVVRASDFDEFANQYERIVGALRFERQQMDRAFTACINERDAALARVTELELKLDQSDYAYDNDRHHMRGMAKQAAEAIQVFTGHDSGANLAHRYGEKWWEHLDELRDALLAFAKNAPPAQAQHSVPDHAELLQALERTHAGHMVGHDQSDQPKGGYSDGYVNGFGECIKVARKVLAAAPGKEGV